MSFRFKDVFPIIAALIQTQTIRGNYITHIELRQRLLESSEGRALVEAAAGSSKLEVEQAAATMIAWFSQQFTVGRNPYIQYLERARVGNRFAYRWRSEKSTRDQPHDGTNTDDWDGPQSGEMIPVEDIIDAWDEELGIEKPDNEKAPSTHSPQLQAIIDKVMASMRAASAVKPPDPAAPARREAYIRYGKKEDLLNIAESYSIPSRTLIAWLDHEGSKWLNDPHEGRDPGPGFEYVASWPDLDTEMEWYARENLAPGRFPDPVFRVTYTNFLKKRAAK